MSYIAHSLSASETLLYRARFPWFYTGGAWLLLTVAAVAAALTEWQGYSWPAAAMVVAGLVLWATILIPIWTTEIGVTNQRLIYKRGLLWRATQELQLRAIEEVNLQQGLLGRLFDFGQLELRGTGVDDIALPSLADPLGLRKALQDGMAAATLPAGRAVPPGAHPTVASSPAA
jgi:membrane protein YdbS with pleckstrin-like domain